MPFVFDIVFGGAMLIAAISLFVGTISALQNNRFVGGALPLTVTIISFFWVLLALIWHGALGPAYSGIQYTIIGINMFGMIACSIISAAVKSQRSWPTVPAASILACVWLYIGAIKSVAG